MDGTGCQTEGFHSFTGAVKCYYTSHTLKLFTFYYNYCESKFKKYLTSAGLLFIVGYERKISLPHLFSQIILA